MTVRKRKKKNRLRGERTHGKGDTKNKRGAGTRGGKGKAGSHKHKYSKYYGTFGKHGTLKAKSRGKSVNVEQIETLLQKWLDKKLVQKEGKVFVINGKKTKISKVLGRGEIKIAVKLVNIKASKKATEKIEKAGGKTETVTKTTVKE